MVQVIFTQQLARFTPLPEVACEAMTLREALEAAFAANPPLRGYVLDEQGHLRKLAPSRGRYARHVHAASARG
jgi:hypothetical protein